MQRASWVAVFFLIGCGGARPIVAGDLIPSVCRTPSFRLVRTFQLGAPVQALVRSGDGFVGVDWTDGERTTELFAFDGDGAVVSRRTLALPDGCDERSLGFDTNGTDAFLGRTCGTVPRLFRAGESAWEPYADLPPPVSRLALDGSTLWWRTDHDMFSAPLPPAAGTVGAPAQHTVVVPHGTSFDVVGGRQFSSTNAFERGMRNGFHMEPARGAAACTYDTERVAGFTGESSAQVVAGDPTAWFYAASGTMAELRIVE